MEKISHRIPFLTWRGVVLQFMSAVFALLGILQILVFIYIRLPIHDNKFMPQSMNLLWVGIIVIITSIRLLFLFSKRRADKKRPHLFIIFAIFVFIMIVQLIAYIITEFLDFKSNEMAPIQTSTSTSDYIFIYFIFNALYAGNVLLAAFCCLFVTIVWCLDEKLFYDSSCVSHSPANMVTPPHVGRAQAIASQPGNVNVLKLRSSTPTKKFLPTVFYDKDTGTTYISEFKNNNNAESYNDFFTKDGLIDYHTTSQIQENPHEFGSMRVCRTLPRLTHSQPHTLCITSGKMMDPIHTMPNSTPYRSRPPLNAALIHNNLESPIVRDIPNQTVQSQFLFDDTQRSTNCESGYSVANVKFHDPYTAHRSYPSGSRYVTSAPLTPFSGKSQQSTNIFKFPPSVPRRVSSRLTSTNYAYLPVVEEEPSQLSVTLKSDGDVSQGKWSALKQQQPPQTPYYTDQAQPTFKVPDDSDVNNIKSYETFMERLSPTHRA